MSSANDALQSAVDALLAKLEVQQKAVAETKKTINNLLHHMDQGPMFDDAEDAAIQSRTLTLRPDQFYGRPLATVAREVLESRGQAMAAPEMIEVLERGGYDFAAQGWKEKDRLRAFTITLAKNNVAFHRLPNGFFGLPKWYPEAVKQRQAAKAERDAAPEGDIQDNSGDLSSAE
jgi:hypothetical protein